MKPSSIPVVVTSRHRVTQDAPRDDLVKRIRLAFDEIQQAIGLDLAPIVADTNLVIGYPKSLKLRLDAKTPISACMTHAWLADNYLIELIDLGAFAHEVGHWLATTWGEMFYPLWPPDEAFYTKVGHLIRLASQEEQDDDPDFWSAPEIWARMFEVWISLQIWKRDQKARPLSCRPFSFYQYPYVLMDGFDASSGKVPGQEDVRYIAGYEFAKEWLKSLDPSFRRWPRRIVREMLEELK